MNRKISLHIVRYLFALASLAAIIIAAPVSAKAEARGNTTITLYSTGNNYLNKNGYLSEKYYEEYVAAWNKADSVYRFPYGSNAVYKVNGNSVTVSADGVVSSRYTGYEVSASTVSVTVGDVTETYTFEVQSFETKYVSEKAQRFLAENITPEMTDLQKFETIVRYPASMDYANYVSYVSMMIFGGGDCIGSAGIINYLCNMVGIPCHTRYAADDSGAASNHRNNAALIDGKVYLADAGYSGRAPRYYRIAELNSGYSYRYSIGQPGTILHYDGFEKNLVVPDTIDSIPIATIGTYAFGAYCAVTPDTLKLPDTITTLMPMALSRIPTIKEITVPKNVNSIGKYAFSDCALLEAIYVDPKNSYFTSINGVLFDKNKSTLLYYPTNGQKNYVLPSTVTTIGDTAFAYTSSVQRLIIPAGVSYIGESAFYNSRLKEIIFLGDRPQFGDYLFSGMYSATVYYPAGNSTWDGIANESFTGSGVKFVESDPNQVNRVQSASVELNEAFTLKLNVQLASTTFMIRLEDGSKSSTYKTSELKKTSDGLYTVSYPVAAKNLGDTIKLTVVDADGSKQVLANENCVDNTLCYCVEDYLDALAKSDSSAAELVNAIKQYSLCARTYFKHNAPAAAPKVPAVDPKDIYYFIYEEGELPEGITFYGVSLLLEDKVTLRYYLLDETGTFQGTGRVNSELAYIETKVTPLYFDVGLGFKKGNYLYSYSVFDYCCDTIKDSDDPALVNLMYSLYWYNKAAHKYEFGW